MAGLAVGNMTLEMDEDGFIQEPDKWNKDVAMALAKTEGVDDLSERHWKLIARSMDLLRCVGNRVLYVPLIAQSNHGNAESMVRWVDRGGDVTYHGPGQLVGYPLIPLGRVDQNVRLPEIDYTGYLRRLEKALIVALAGFGVAAGQIVGLTGVWVQPDVYSRCVRCRPEDRQKPAKIAAIGVKVDANGISRHGFALNVDPDMSYFDGIIPCGLNEPVVSLAELRDPAPSLTDAKKAAMEAFCEIFDFTMTLKNDLIV